MSTDSTAAPSSPHSLCPICCTDHRRGVPPVCHEPDAPRPCTWCEERVLGGFLWRGMYGHLGCTVPYALAALASETVSVREAGYAAYLVDLFARGRVADARRRERHAGIARDIRGVVGLPTPEAENAP